MQRRVSESENEVRVYKFGCRANGVDLKPALDQMWLMNKYRNALVQHDREFRALYNKLIGAGNPFLERIKAIDQRIHELRAQIKIQRTGTRRGGWKNLSLTEKEEIAKLKTERLQLKPHADRIRTINKVTNEPQVKELNRKFFEIMKSIQGSFTDGTYTDLHGNTLGGLRLYWMNEEHIASNFLKDRIAAMKVKPPTLLKFHRWDGEGVIACRPRLQTLEDSMRKIGIAVKQEGKKSSRVSVPVEGVKAFLAAHTEAKIVRADQKRYEQLTNGGMKEQQKVLRSISVEQAMQGENGSAFYFDQIKPLGIPESKRSMHRFSAVAHLQIGTDSDSKTFFAMPVILHRPLTKGAVIKGVALECKRLGRRYRWNLLVTIDYPKPAPTCGKGVLALDPGWAKETLPGADGRLRVAGLTDEKGNFTELALPKRFLDSQGQVNRLQSHIDEATNKIMEGVNAWLDKDKDGGDIAAMLANARIAHSTAKRAKHGAGGFRHLIKAVWAMRNGAKFNDADLRMNLEVWYKAFRHLDEWKHNLQDQNNAFKLHTYRVWASEAAKKYHTLVIDDSDLRKAAKEPSAEKDKAKVAGGQRQLGAPSILISAFKNAFKSAGGEVVYVQAMTSRTCAKCKHVNPALSAERIFICEACGYRADREFNTGQNLIAFYKAGQGSKIRRSTQQRSKAKVVEAGVNAGLQLAA